MQFSDEVWDGKKPVSKEEDRAVVDWLDRQHAGSVLYIRSERFALSDRDELKGVMTASARFAGPSCVPTS